MSPLSGTVHYVLRINGEKEEHPTFLEAFKRAQKLQAHAQMRGRTVSVKILEVRSRDVTPTLWSGPHASEEKKLRGL